MATNEEVSGARHITRCALLQILPAETYFALAMSAIAGVGFFLVAIGAISIAATVNTSALLCCILVFLSLIYYSILRVLGLLLSFEREFLRMYEEDDGRPRNK